jgi:pilus assembly protein CpaF
MNEDFSEIIAAVKKFAVDNLSLSTLSDEELEEQIKTITDNMIGNRYVSIKNRVDIAQQVFSSIRGFGLLDTIMNDDTITEVMINGADNIFIEQAGRVKRLDESFESQRKLEDIIQRIVGKAGREVNQSNPIVDTRLPDGSRVNVVLPPIALCGPTVTIRKFSKTPMTIEKLISYGSITREIADKLKLLVEAKYNIFICGGTGSGKTTFLNALSNYIPKDERVITIEDSAELQIKGVDNLVSLETRNANASGAGAVTIRDLIKSSLRMRPERIVVGEVRGGEALDMLQAMNTGHDGSLSTAGSEGSADFDTLINLTNATCDVSYVGGSEVYHSNILKRQILEYMKYRGVVAVSQELINKFSGFSGFDKQSKAIKAKMNYEKELEKVGDSCQTAYNELYEARKQKHTSVTQDILGYEIEADCENKIELFKDAYLKTVSLAKENYDNISKYLVYIKVLEDTSADKLNVNSNVILYNEISNKSSEATENMGEGLKEGHTVTNEAYTHKGLEGVLSNVEYFKSNNIGLTSGCEMNDEKTDFNVISDHDGGFYGTMKSFVDDIKSQKSNINGELSEDNVIKVYQLKQTINNWINNDDNKTYLANIWALKDYFYSCEGNDCKINEYFENIEGFISDINDIANYTNNYANSYKDKVKSLAVEANKQIRLVFDDCTIMISKYEAIEKDLNAVISDIESAEEKGEKWKDKIDKVTDKSSKQTMTSDYESEAQPLKKADVEALRDKVIIVNKEFYQDILDRIKSLKYCGNKLAEKYDSSKVEKADYEKDFKKSKIMPDTVDSNGMAAAINSAKANFESDTGNSFKAFRRLLENDEFSTKSGFTTKAQEENQQFFEYLASNFEYKSGTEEEEKSEASDGGKEALIDKGKVTSAKENAKNDKTLSGDVSSDFLDAMVTNNSKSQQDIGVDPTDPEGSSDDNVTDTADSMSDEETTSFLKALGDIAATERDKLYLVEYMRNMFSCYTTNIDPDAGNPNVEEKKDKEVGSQYENKDDFEKTLSGIAISADNNYYYGGECEYILWGGTPSSAVNKTKASIFGIRFILNLIYAMSAPDINALTFEWATVIAGWTVFGVPIVQTVLKIALALAESAYDLNQLCLGKSVPLYKSSTTWAMSPQGMIGIAKDAAAELIENAAKEAGAYLNDSITNIFDKIENTANNKISEIGDDVKKYMNQTIRDVSDKVINATVTPFMNGIKGVLGKIDSSWGKDKIKEELQNCLDKLKEGATDDIYGQAKTVAIEYLEGKIGEVTDTIYDSLQEAAGVKSETIIGKINDLFKTVDSGVNSGTGYISELNDVISNKITELSGDLKKTVTDTLNSTEDNVKEKLNEALNNFSNELSEKVSGGLDKVGESAPNSKTVGDVSNAKAATISLNYKEYLYAFMLIGILANEDNMVARTGYLMQMNISQKMTDAGFNDSDRENFDMTKMYTMVQIHSEADVDSVFMGMFEKKTVNGEESYSLNFDGDGSSTDRLVYNGFIGY